MNLHVLLFIGSQEIIIIAVIILLLFGGRKIPELMRGLGSGIKEFKQASKEEKNQDSKSAEKHLEEDSK